VSIPGPGAIPHGGLWFFSVSLNVMTGIHVINYGSPRYGSAPIPSHGAYTLITTNVRTGLGARRYRSAWTFLLSNLLSVEV
jgi:hypothetical protein